MKRFQSRGPDSSNVICHDGWWFGHNRLKIIDLDDRSNQPMESGEFIILFNGEIYNFRQLAEEYLEDVSLKTSSDTEVVLELWRKFGISSIKLLRGMWSISVYDKLKSEVYLIRDFFGIKPLLYRHISTSLEWSSDLRFWDTEKLEINDYLINTFIMNGRVHHDDNTFYTNIKTVRPGECIKFSSDGSLEFLNLREYIEVPGDTFSHQGLSNSIQAHLVSDVRISASLSGGIDSSTLVAECKNAISAVFTAVNKTPGDDEYFATRLASLYAQKQLLVSFDNLDIDELLNKTIMDQQEPFDGFSVVLQNALYENIKREGFKVNLSGQGADELFLGYKKYLYLYVRENKISGIVNIIRKNSDISIFDCLLAYIVNPWIIGQYNKLWSYVLLRNTNYFDYFTDLFVNMKRGLFNLQQFEIFHGNLQDLLRYEDRNSMGHSIESRVPFVDRELFASVIGDRKLLQGDRFKSYLINQSKIPDFIKNRKSKLGFHAEIKDYLKRSRKEMLKVVMSGYFVHNYSTFVGRRILYFNNKLLIRFYILEKWKENCL